ncbi:TolC family protein [Pseudomonas sp. CC6-YY-74]|uniref:TolC family protein n=1 Tax=Pseudomonas sp. CC6-YY-74 TaxID=1930532 RepID=UPI0009A2418D|nr:TolC family protein [Pseudomonas sp. CC6-YY-74]
MSRLLTLSLVLVVAPGTAALAESPLGLGAALRATLSLNPAVSGKQAEVSAKNFTSDSARAQRYPTLSAQLSAEDGASAPPSSVRIRQPLWAFGRIDSNIAYADADISVGEADLIRVKRQLIEQTAVAYAQVLGARQRQLIATGNVAGLDKLYQRIQRRQLGQAASAADVRLARARLIQANAQQARYAAELAVSETELLALTQIAVRVEPSLPSAMTSLPDGAELETLALAHSADLLLKAQQVSLAEAGVKRENTAAMPTLYLQADQYFNQQNNFNNNDDTQVGLVLDATLEGLGFAVVGRSKAAQAHLQAAEDDQRSTRNEIIRAVKSLYSNRQLQHSLIRSQAESVTELTEILASYRRQYAAGLKSWLDVLNMQREWNEQLIQQAQAENEWLIYTLKLAALTGGLDALASGIKN